MLAAPLAHCCRCDTAALIHETADRTTSRDEGRAEATQLSVRLACRPEQFLRVTPARSANRMSPNGPTSAWVDILRSPEWFLGLASMAGIVHSWAEGRQAGLRRNQSADSHSSLL